MIIGSSLAWLKQLKDIDHSFIQCVEKVWPQVISRMNTASWEDHITERLVDLLKKDRSIIKYGFLACQYKLREEDIFGGFSNKGILDLTNPHEIINKIDQKQQLNKICINARVKACHCEGMK